MHLYMYNHIYIYTYIRIYVYTTWFDKHMNIFIHGINQQDRMGGVRHFSVIPWGKNLRCCHPIGTCENEYVKTICFDDIFGYVRHEHQCFLTGFLHQVAF